MVLRQLPAATARSAVPSFQTAASFSASANVVVDTSGPTAGPAPKAGGAPGGRSAGFWAGSGRDFVKHGFCPCPRSAAAAPSTAQRCNSLEIVCRDFAMSPSAPHCSVCDAEVALRALARPAEIFPLGESASNPQAGCDIRHRLSGRVCTSVEPLPGSLAETKLPM